MKRVHFLLFSIIVFTFSVSQTFANIENVQENQKTSFLQILNPFWQVPKLDSTPSIFTINLPIENTGKVSIIPTGKITILNENGEQVKNIAIDGKRDDFGNLIEQKIVDYIPINPEGQKVPAGQSLDIKVKWKGIAQKTENEGISTIEFLSIMPNSQKVPKFSFWEKLITIEHYKNFIARVDIEYKDLGLGNILQKSINFPIQISYLEIKKQINWSFIFIVIGGIFLFFGILIPGHRERVKEKNKEAIKNLEKDTKEVLSKIKKKSKSSGTKKMQKKVKKIKKLSN